MFILEGWCRDRSVALGRSGLSGVVLQKNSHLALFDENEPAISGASLAQLSYTPRKCWLSEQDSLSKKFLITSFATIDMMDYGGFSRDILGYGGGYRHMGQSVSSVIGDIVKWKG